MRSWIVASAVLLTTVDVMASLQLCNNTPHVLYTAVGFKQGDQWRARGWYRVVSGTCVMPIEGNLTNRYYYFRANDEDGGRVWDGDAEFCASPSERFDSTDEPCTAAGMRKMSFRKIDTQSRSDYTTALTCEGCVFIDHRPLTIPLPNTGFRVTAYGRTMQSAIGGSVTVSRNGDGLAVSVDARVDLGDFQAQFGPMVQSQLNHDDDCDYKLNVHTIDLVAINNAVRVFAAAHYEHWECLEVFGLDAGKHRIFEQSADMTAYVTPATDGNNIWLNLQVADFGGDGLAGELLDSNWFGPFLRDLILQAIPTVVHIGSLRQMLPPELQPFGITIDGAEFFDQGGGRLGLHVRASGRVSPDAAGSVWQSLH